MSNSTTQKELFVADRLRVIYLLRPETPMISSVETGTFARIFVEQDDNDNPILRLEDDAMPEHPLVLPLDWVVSITPIIGDK
jgi:hypothetical protein